VIVSRAPFRLSLFGGGTDYPEYFNEVPTVVTAVAINKHCYITMRSLPPFFETHRTRLVYSKIEAVKSHSELYHPTARACLTTLNVPEGLEIHHDGDLPARSGIGTSAAFTVSLLVAIHKYQQKAYTAETISRLAIAIERDGANEPVGVQDQIISAYGGALVISCGPGNNLDVRPLKVNKDYLAALSKSVLMGFHGSPRFGAEHAAGLVKGIREGRYVSRLDELRHLSLAALEALESEQSFKKIGELLRVGWELKKSLAVNEHQLSDLDSLLERANSLGAFGGKLMGAGGSGFFYILADPGLHDKLRSEFSSVSFWSNISFSDIGAETWQIGED